MKYYRIIILAIFCIIAISVSAQYVVNRPRKGCTPTKEHLTFEGIPINGHCQDLINQLNTKGYQAQTKSSGNHLYQYMTGKYADTDNWELYIDSDDDFKDSIYSVRLFHEFATGSTQNATYWQVKKHIESQYNVTGKIKFIGEKAIDEESETIYNIGGKGTITVAMENCNGQLFVGVNFKDNTNDRLYGYHPEVRRYEMKNVSPNFQTCIIETSEIDIKYNIKCVNKVYTFISRGDDLKQIKNLLEGNYSDQMKVYILTNYVNTGLKRSKEEDAIPIIESECERILSQYLAVAESTKSKETKAMQPKNILLEALRQMIFSPKERKMLDKVVPPEIQRQMIGGTISIMTDSSPSHYTDYEKYINPYLHD